MVEKTRAAFESSSGAVLAYCRSGARSGRAVEMMRRGAADYLFKDRLSRLGAAIVNRRCLEPELSCRFEPRVSGEHDHVLVNHDRLAPAELLDRSSDRGHGRTGTGAAQASSDLSSMLPANLAVACA